MDKELEHAIQKYSEIKIKPSKTYEVPQSIQNYKERIKANDSVSVFDSYLSNSYTNLDAKCVSKARNDNKDIPFQKEPGDFSDDNDIKKDLRRIAPLGYSNEITELAINSKNSRSKKNTLNNSQCENIRSASTSKEKLENSQPSIGKILQETKKQRDSAYRTLFKQKEEQMANNTVATKRKTKELVEEDRKQFYTDLEKSYDSVGTDRRTETGVKSDFVFGKGRFYSNKLNLNSSSDFPSLSGRKKM